jgi:hypothetical protein
LNGAGSAENALEKSKRIVQENRELTDENGRLCTSLSQTEAKLVALQASNATLNDRLEELEQQAEGNVTQVAAELADAESRAAAAAAERQTFSSRLQMAESIIVNSEGKIQQLSTVEKDNESLHLQLERLRANAQEETAALRVELAQLNSSENSSVIDSVVQASRDSLREAEEHLRRTVEQSVAAAGLHEENSSLQRNLESARLEKQELELQLIEATGKVEAVSSMLDTTEASLRTAELSLLNSRDGAAMLGEVQHENALLRRELEVAAQASATVVRAAEDENAQLRSRVADQEQSNSAHTQECTLLRDQLAEVQMMMERGNKQGQDEVASLRDRFHRAELMGREVQSVLDVTKGSLGHAERSLLHSKASHFVGVCRPLKGLAQCISDSAHMGMPTGTVDCRAVTAPASSKGFAISTGRERSAGCTAAILLRSQSQPTP